LIYISNDAEPYRLFLFTNVVVTVPYSIRCLSAFKHPTVYQQYVWSEDRCRSVLYVPVPYGTVPTYLVLQLKIPPVSDPPSGCTGTVPSVSIYGVFLAPAPKADPRSDGVSVHRGRDGARPGVASAAALFLRALREGVHVKAQTSAPCAQRSFWVRPQLQFTYP
jgi:hypothetical protein